MKRVICGAEAPAFSFNLGLLTPKEGATDAMVTPQSRQTVRLSSFSALHLGQVFTDGYLAACARSGWLGFRFGWSGSCCRGSGSCCRSGRCGCARLALSSFFVAFATVVRDVKSRSFEDEPRAGSNKTAHFAFAPFGHAAGSLLACLEGLIFHGLEGLKTLSAFLALVIVGRHTFCDLTSRAESLQYCWRFP